MEYMIDMAIIMPSDILTTVLVHMSQDLIKFGSLD